MSADSAVARAAWLESTAVEGSSAKGDRGLIVHSAGSSSLGVEGGLPTGVAKADEVQLGVCEGVDMSRNDGEERWVMTGGGGGGGVLSASCSVWSRGKVLGCQGKTTVCMRVASSGSA